MILLSALLIALANPYGAPPDTGIGHNPVVS